MSLPGDVQVHRYIREYSQAARSFPEDSLRRLEEAFEAAAGATTGAPTERTRLLLNYLHDASSMCREVWTQVCASVWGCPGQPAKGAHSL